MLVGLPIHFIKSKQNGGTVVTEESQNPGLFADSMLLNQFSIYSLPPLPKTKEKQC